MPPNTRASLISASTDEKLANVRVPGLTSDVSVTAVSSPKAAAKTKAAAPLTVECPEGYSGWAGVPAGKVGAPIGEKLWVIERAPPPDDGIAGEVQVDATLSGLLDQLDVRRQRV